MGSFSPDNYIEEIRFKKQYGRCALCSKELVYENFNKGDKGSWHAHHIDGDAENNGLDNCACVCINNPPNCHLNIAHLGDYNSDSIVPLKWLRLNGWTTEELRQIKSFQLSEILDFHARYST